ncbi:MAG: high frequency lysogenization protein HflD [Pseudomonadales bacterium]|nr:high frequency lysogenization protein HflD [Pseudomonadales bacterium]
MKHSFEEQVLAIAGMVQAGKLVDDLAKKGLADNRDLETMMYALLETDPKNTESVFIDKSHLKNGLSETVDILQQQSTQASDTLRYVLGMVYLERKLTAHQSMLQVVASRISQCKQQIEHFPLTHENIIANAASIYADTLSTFRFRIQVNGQPQFLQQKDNVNKIRAMLLAGIRSAVLWRQVGGSRLKVIIHRRKIIECAKTLLKT